LLDARPIIRIENLSKRFEAKSGDVQALENISLDIMPGEIFGIIGMSGAGKSTLVRCINYLEKPTGGRVLFDGRDLSEMKQKELYRTRQSMGMIFQQFNLLMQRTALDNVCFPLEIAGVKKSDARDRAAGLLELVGMADKAEAYPAQLSGGQLQRVAIARALATDPKVLLCDEATSALDPSTTRGVLELLKSINRRLGITIVVITHEMSVIEEICHRVAIIDDSRIAEVGSVGDVFANPKTAAGRRLVYPGERPAGSLMGSRCCRIVFEGNASSEPVIANMVLEFREPVNILYADTRDIDGKAYGQIVIQLPASEQTGDRMLEYLRQRGLKAEEVDGFV